jgi:hypothetical protein
MGFKTEVMKGWMEKLPFMALFLNITIRSNRLMLKSRGLKHKPIDWRLESGEVKNQKNFQQVIKKEVEASKEIQLVNHRLTGVNNLIRARAFKLKVDSRPFTTQKMWAGLRDFIALIYTE